MKSYRLKISIALLAVAYASLAGAETIYQTDNFDDAPVGGYRALTVKSFGTLTADEMWYTHVAGAGGARVTSGSNTDLYYTPPTGMTGGTALRLFDDGASSTASAHIKLTDTWDSAVETYRFTLVARVAHDNGSTADATAVGDMDINLFFQQADTSRRAATTSAALSSGGFTPGTGEWGTYTFDVAGADLFASALGEEIVISLDRDEVTTANHYTWVDSITVQTVPEPATIGLVGVSAGALLFMRRLFRI